MKVSTFIHTYIHMHKSITDWSIRVELRVQNNSPPTHIIVKSQKVKLTAVQLIHIHFPKEMIVEIRIRIAYLVAVMRAERMPIMPLVGTRNFNCVWPSDPSLGPISVISPLRLFSRDTTALLNSLGTVMSTTSNGSHFSPSMVFSMTVGGPTINSNPSRRMFSIKTVKWSCPRPQTYMAMGNLTLGRLPKIWGLIYGKPRRCPSYLFRTLSAPRCDPTL